MKFTIITGGCGFLGANLVKKLNHMGNNRIIIVDNYDRAKFNNLKELNFSDYISFDQDLDSLKKSFDAYELSGIVHVGANADVLEKDPNVMLRANYEHSKFYLNLSRERDIPFIYASSSAVYGNASKSSSNPISEDPHNIYAWSKWLFDKHVTANLESYENKVIGLRLFNIFGMGEFHKGKNASLPLRFFTFVKENGFIDVFDKHIERDYVWVEDVADVFLDFLGGEIVANGIYDLGGNNPISHKEVASIVADAYLERGIKIDKDTLITMVAMPEALQGNFQFHTKANELLPRIAEHTKDNKEKIRRYVNQLLDMNYGDN